MKKNIIKGEKAVSLIALVITIVLLLIISGITISNLKDKKIISQTENVVNYANKTQLIEEINIKLLKEQKKTRNTTIPQATIVDILDDYGEVLYEQDGTTLKGVRTEKGYEISVSELEI